jgi:hypothetical protein
MSWYRYGWIQALGAVVLGVLALGSVNAASVWFVLDPDKIVCDALGTRTCGIEIAWSVSNEDRFDKWKICWKPKDSSTWLDDHCNYNSKVRKIENNFYVIPGLEMGGILPDQARGPAGARRQLDLRAQVDDPRRGPLGAARERRNLYRLLTRQDRLAAEHGRCEPLKIRSVLLTSGPLIYINGIYQEHRSVAA